MGRWVSKENQLFFLETIPFRENTCFGNNVWPIYWQSLETSGYVPSWVGWTLNPLVDRVVKQRDEPWASLTLEPQSIGQEKAHPKIGDFQRRNRSDRNAEGEHRTVTIRKRQPLPASLRLAKQITALAKYLSLIFWSCSKHHHVVTKEMVSNYTADLQHHWWDFECMSEDEGRSTFEWAWYYR